MSMNAYKGGVYAPIRTLQPLACEELCKRHQKIDVEISVGSQTFDPFFLLGSKFFNNC